MWAESERRSCSKHGSPHPDSWEAQCKTKWQALEKEEFDPAISKWGTDGLNLKHSYPEDKWVLVPLGHWNWKWVLGQGYLL